MPAMYWESTKDLWGFPIWKQFGWVLSDPVKSEKYPGHYRTYLESPRDCDKNTRDNDTEHTRCTMCPNWIFSSANKQKKITNMWRWGTPQNFLVAFIDELWKTQKIRILKTWKKLLERSLFYTCVHVYRKPQSYEV